jgi:ubiquinone/menaquinone biosynthesis C-methylase UbiE
MMSVEEAILELRRDASMADILRDSYLDEDVLACGERFLHSPEFAETWKLLGWKARGGTVVDVGAGRGIASYAFVRSGVARVIAVEPDPSEVVGHRALGRLCQGLPVEIVSELGETLSLPDESVDVVYARQVLHHISDLRGALRQFSRVLRREGVFLAAREHVAETNEELRAFLASHAVHRLAGGENARPLRSYRAAIQGAGLLLCADYGQWDSIISAAPLATCEEDLRHYPRVRLRKRFGFWGRLSCKIPGVEALLRARWQKPFPGRLHTFLAIKT